MVWAYEVTTRKLYHNNVLIYSNGYAGRGEHKDKPTSEHIPNWGPIPRGKWRINGHTNSKGPLTIVLTPAAGTHTYGRTDFRIHGDSISSPGTASEGCIIVGYNARLAIVNSGDSDLEVVW